MPVYYWHKYMQPRTAPRKAANLSLNQSLLNEAKSLHINVSRAAEAGIENAVKEKKRERLLKNNAEALDSANAYVEKHGLPLAKYRQF